MSVVPAIRPRLGVRWQAFEAWVGTRSSVLALFALALAVFAVQSTVLPAEPGRDMSRYVQTFVQLGYRMPILPSVLNTRGPLAALGVGVPLELGGWATEIWLALLYAASVVAWGAVAWIFGARAAILTTGLLLVYPGYGILFHTLASDSLTAAAFAGWAFLLSRAILRPSTAMFLVAGFGMGVCVLARPSNQVLIVFALLPLLLRASWGRRLTWTASFFVASAAVTQGWRVLATARWGDTVGLSSSRAVLGTALALALVLAIGLLPSVWRRRLAIVALPVAAVLIGIAAVRVHNPVEYPRTLAQIPSGNVYLFRAFEMERIMAPDNGPASRQLAHVVERDLLSKEPYRSYGVDLHTFFSSGSDRMFGDMTGLNGVDLAAATNEAIRRHRWAFATGIARTIWQVLWARRVYAPGLTYAGDSRAGVDGTSSGGTSQDYVVVNGRTLPRPTDGQPIPASRFGPVYATVGPPAREVWRSPTEHPTVFADPLDARRLARFDRQTNRLLERIPTREGNPSLVHRLDQASHAFPPLVFWLVLGLVAVAVRRPCHARVALALTTAALVVIVSTSFVASAVAEYAAPFSPAFLLLTAAGLVGDHPRGGLRLSRGHGLSAG